MRMSPFSTDSSSAVTGPGAVSLSVRLAVAGRPSPPARALAAPASEAASQAPSSRARGVDLMLVRRGGDGKVTVGSSQGDGGQRARGARAQVLALVLIAG